MMEILYAKEEVLDKENLKVHLAKLASDNIVKPKSDLSTYPIARVKENIEYIGLIADLLREHIKIEIPIHPAGEWILDNFYIIEKAAKTIQKELSKYKYVNLPGISENGFARIYVIANEIISNTDGKISQNDLIEYLNAYQTQKKLMMEEIWLVGLFLQIVLIEKIRHICERIFVSQAQKFRAQNITGRIIENEDIARIKIPKVGESYPFIEHMSFILKSYGKDGQDYLEALEEEVEKTGVAVSEIIAREHFDIAMRKLSMTNAINSLRNISKMNLSVVFRQVNVVEQILNDDPAKVYQRMDYQSKEDYRTKILEISKKTKISEFYVASEALKLSQECNNIKSISIKQNEENNSEIANEKRSHVGYYLIDDGYDELISRLLNRSRKKLNLDTKAKLYVSVIYFLTIIVTAVLFKYIGVLSILLFIPIQNAVTLILQYIISKNVKPRHIPKVELEDGISKESSTMCIIPTSINSVDDVKDIFEKMEVYYLANKSENLFFTLLGDCKSSKQKEEQQDKDIIKVGKELAQKLNEKYGEKFFFTYRKREWAESERCFMGWERKRGMILEFNEFLLTGNSKFKVNTCIKENLPKIKYVITLDSDTGLIMDSVFKLVGAMSHILNKPEVDKIKNKVVSGYGIIQPRVALDIESGRRSLFTRVFAGSVGLDIYSLAAFDVYQDLFGEGIFTGKGIYDLEVFQSVLKDSIPERKVLSHDLIEGSFIRCALANDIFVTDGYPGSYHSYKIRRHRWIRGDVQILGWLKSNLNFLSKYKILDNLVRNLNEVFIFLCIIIGMISVSAKAIIVPLVILIMPLIISLIDLCVNKRSGEAKNKLMSPNFSRMQSSFFKTIMDIILLPDIANLEVNAIAKALYRMNVSHKFLLEWTTANEAEKKNRNSIVKYYSSMKFSVIIGILSVIYPLGILWIYSPLIMFLMSKKEEEYKRDISKENKKYLIGIAKKTWDYFKDNMTNYLITDNYQEDRREKAVKRTSPTNIGFEILAIISSYDLGFETKEYVIDLLDKVIDVTCNLQKWNGHLFNWYDTEKLEVITPFEVSSVDSANFICYLYTLKQFLIEQIENGCKNKKQAKGEKDKLQRILEKVKNMIDQADFSVLYDTNSELFSIGYNVEENKLLESNYDLLASEARQISLVAIAKKDVPSRHWNALGRTLTTVNNYKGLMSWGGTAFEYLMPNIIIPSYESSLLDESCKVLIMSQKQYAGKRGIPWGISESAYSIKDLYDNYQYKTFGIPWLGLKRGLEKDSVISPYSTALALSVDAKSAISNLKRLEKEGAVGKYGFYEAIDYIPKKQIVKSYMAHHEGMILTSIDNKLNKNIFQKRFMQNPEIKGVKILLQERVPENIIINNEKDASQPDIAYETYDDVEIRSSGVNIISTRDLSTIDYEDSSEIIKMRDNILTTDNSIYIKDLSKNEVYDFKEMVPNANFTMYDSSYSFENKSLKATARTTIAPDIEVGIREIKLKNKGNEKLNIEIITCAKPIMQSETAYEQHPAFNNMFLRFKEIDNGKIIISRKTRDLNEHTPFLATTLFSEDGSKPQYEIDKEKLMKRGETFKESFSKNYVPFNSNVDVVINPIIAMKIRIEIEPNETKKVYLISSSSYDEDKAKEGLEEYINAEKLTRVFELSRVQTEAEARYMELGNEEIPAYQKMLKFILGQEDKVILSEVNNDELDNKIIEVDAPNQSLWEYGISGDYPIVLVKIKDLNDFHVVDSMIKAYEYFASKHIKIELVIMTKVDIEDKLESTDKAKYIGKKAGIFVLDNIKREKQKVIESRACFIIDAHKGSVTKQMKELDSDELLKENKKELNDKKEKLFEISNIDRTLRDRCKTGSYKAIRLKKNNMVKDDIINEQDLMFFNGYGGFTKDGMEYWIIQTKKNRLPVAWSNILTNDKFGSVVTDSMRWIYMVCK